MCGLNLIFSSVLNMADVARFREMLLLSGLRGMDSTGVISVRQSHKPGKKGIAATFRKKAIDPVGFMYEKESQPLWSSEPDTLRLLVGHTRLATQGDIKDDNAHPFKFSNVIGVHNGTISYKFEGSDKYETDSQALYALINERGIEAALQEIEDRGADGAYALIYLDLKEKTLNIVRNNRRPLYVAWNSSHNTMYAMSELAALKYIADRSTGTKLEITGQFAPLQPLHNTLYTWDLTDSSCIEFTRSDLKIKPRIVNHSFNYGGQYYRNIDDWRRNNSTPIKKEDSTDGASCDVPALEKGFSQDSSGKQTSTSTGSTQAKEVGKEIIPFSAAPSPWKSSVKSKAGVSGGGAHNSADDPIIIGGVRVYEGYNRMQITESRLRDILRSGCSWCQRSHDIEDRSTIKWYNHDTFLCEDCVRDTDISEMFSFIPGSGIYQ